MTANPDLLQEAEKLFLFLKKRKKQSMKKDISFRHLLVGQFNLQKRFLDLIAREISHAEKGLPAAITIKLNNLEDKVLISKLYEASQKGVQIRLMVRSICCLVPGVKGMSENISVKRIVDRYLEHGRSFVFHNNGHEEVFIGSADWMNRNLYRRIEVCCPIQNPILKTELLEMIDLQFSDNHQAVVINHECCNIPVSTDTAPTIRSQKLVGELLSHTPPV
jgi:polyphosphate kinase